MPGFFNHKYRPAPVITVEYSDARRLFRPMDFPQAMRDVEGHKPTAKQTKRWARPPSDVRERARRYIASIPPAVVGEHGDAATYRVCCRLVRGFALDEEDALAVLKEWNDGCSPPWSEEELRAKLEGARRYGREPIGGLLATSPSCDARR
jgi:hypothetical protein